jgi:hypothetical protein
LTDNFLTVDKGWGYADWLHGFIGVMLCKGKIAILFQTLVEKKLHLWINPITLFIIELEILQSAK